MRQYRTNELQFNLPKSLQDDTHHLFRTGQGCNSDFNLVVSRATLELDETFPKYCDRLLSDLRRSLSGFELQFHRFVVVAEQPAYALDYRWNSEGQWLHQRQINIFYSSWQRTPAVVQLTASVVGVFSAQWSKTFMEIVNSISLREPGALV